MAYRNKVFVSFDGDNDIHYYRLMLAWTQNDNSPFEFNNAHDLNTARDTSQEASVKAQLRERLWNTKVFVSLIGSQTRYLYKFVRWELEEAVLRDIPIIGVNLNGRRSRDDALCPPMIRDELVMYVSFQPAILQYALENWPAQYAQLKSSGSAGPYYYKESTYKSLGI